MIYTTPAFAQDTEVTGPVSLELFAKSSAVDTDFTAKLVDVGPDGFARNLTEGIIRARYRDSREKAEPDEPGTGLQVHHRFVVHQQRVSEGAHVAAGNFQQQFPALRPEL